MPLVLAGLIVPTPDLEVRSWLETGLHWKDGQKHPASGRVYVASRPSPPELGVMHATGGERGAAAVFDNLTARGYSVEFCLDAEGVLYQFADPMVHRCLHVGGLNDRALGVECVNVMYPFRRGGKRPDSEGLVQVVGPKPGPYPDDFIVRSGQKLYYRRSFRKPALGLTEAQKRALGLFVRYLGEQGVVLAERADRREYVPRAERAQLRGWVGHSQVTLGHGDPSLDALDLLG